MRKLQIAGIYLTILLTLFFTPKPKSLLTMETYESKLRNNDRIEEEKNISIVNNIQLRDTFSYIQPTP